jgi:hypothetical protein
MADREESEGSNAAQAFEQLTQEVAVLHHQVEELVDAIGLKDAPDYSPTLADMAKNLEALRARLDEMEQHPALRVAPAQFAEAVKRAASEAMREAFHQLDEARRESERTTQALARILVAARSRDQQRKWLMISAAVALAVGLIGSPFLARLLPFGLEGRIAAAIMATDRWNAGAHLMAAQNPEGWRELQSAAALLTPNKAALATCWDVAAKAKKEQRCTVVVPVP